MIELKKISAITPQKVSNIVANEAQATKSKVQPEKNAELEKSKADKKPLFNIPFFKKLKGVKHIEVVVVIALIALMVILFLPSLSSISNNSSQNNSNLTTYTQTSQQYANMLEEKIVDVISLMEGVGQVKAMVTVQSGPELIIAFSTEERTVTSASTGGGTTIDIVKEPVIIGGESPMVLMEKTPQVTGVIVVAEGADNLRVLLDISSAVANVLAVTEQMVQVYNGKV